MRHTLFLLLCALAWTQIVSQENAKRNVTEEDKKRLKDIFGAPDDNSTLSEDDKNNLKNLFPPPPDAPECETDHRPGFCVPYYQCSLNGTVITDGRTLINVRFGAPRTCSHYLDSCCILEEIREPPPPPKVEQTECGWTNPGAVFRTIGGEGWAEYGEYPWMVAVLKRSSGNGAWSQNDFVGGGTIIHPQVVLTGAHKVDGKIADDLKCRGGEWDIQTIKEIYPHQERNVKKIVQHPDYFATSVFNSVALLILESPYSLGNAPHMGVACLAPREPPSNALCQSMGWGRYSEDKEYAYVLKKVELPWLNHDTCQQQLRQTRLGRFFKLNESLACAGGEKNKDMCTGDGGSPLVCPIGDAAEGRFAVFGMVAYGLGCGLEHVPGVYVNVPHLYQWIGDKMAAEGFSTSTYTYNYPEDTTDK